MLQYTKSSNLPTKRCCRLQRARLQVALRYELVAASPISVCSLVSVVVRLNLFVRKGAWGCRQAFTPQVRYAANSRSAARARDAIHNNGVARLNQCCQPHFWAPPSSVTFQEEWARLGDGRLQWTFCRRWFCFLGYTFLSFLPLVFLLSKWGRDSQRPRRRAGNRT